MKGIQGDAFLIFIGILLLALFTVKFWYPPLVRLVGKVRSDLDKVRRDEVDYTRTEKMIAEKEPEYRQTSSKPISSMTPQERAELYRERARQLGIGAPRGRGGRI